MVEMLEVGGMVKVVVTEPLPGVGIVGSIYKIKGTAMMFDAIGSLPWVYAEVKKKEWYKPEVVEETSYERGFPNPINGEFSIDFKPEKAGDYEVTVVATPAPLSLPAIGVFPVVSKGDVMKVAVSKAPPAAFRFSVVNVDGNLITLANKDVDSKLLLVKTTADYLEIIPSFEWTGPRKDAVISIKAGYKRLLDWEPKTGAYTQSITLPAAIEVYKGSLEKPIKIPLTACGGLTDGAIEVVLKISGVDDYISHIWNVYATKLPSEAYNFILSRPQPSNLNPVPGETITLTCPVQSTCVSDVTAQVKVIIYEGSFFYKHGTKLREYTSSPFLINPYQVQNIIVTHQCVAGTIDRRDVEVEIYVANQLIKEDEWDDVYRVGAAGPPPPPPPEAPKVSTLDAVDIIHDTAKLKGKLIDTGFWSQVYIYFEWGKTATYGNETAKLMMYEGQEGNIFSAELLHKLNLNTTYHFRAMAIPIGDRSEGVIGYGIDRSFQTASVIIVGFTMKVINPPAGAEVWRAGFSIAGDYPWMQMPELFNYTWNWPGSVPDLTMDFFVVATGPHDTPYTRPLIQYDVFPFRLQNGKAYVWNFLTRVMTADGIKVWPPY